MNADEMLLLAEGMRNEGVDGRVDICELGFSFTFLLWCLVPFPFFSSISLVLVVRLSAFVS